MRYLAKQLSKDAEVLLEIMQQDHVKDNIVVQNTNDQINIYLFHNITV